ncbi:MAG TPA: CHC2 zinc finger domain-containing protein, partial [Verrucomicrobiae bacterium]|nr:CHC2 zinc finger domain-containing protein [Verrucomicrobiae bacterium]
MPKAQFVDFKAIKAAITMEQVLTHYGLMDKFKRGTDSLSGPCPIHKGSNPTQFRVSISKNVWNCFSECKHGGNVLDFIAKMEDVSIHAAALKAIEWFNLDAKEMSAEDAGETDETPASTPAAKRPASPAVATAEKSIPNTPLKFRLDKLEREHPYLMQERGLTLETIVDFGAGFCSKGTMADRIAIPIHNANGEVVAYAGRFPVKEPPEGTPKYKLPQGFRKSQELFNLDRAMRESGPLFIVEGFFDCMKLHQHGCKKVVALMGSTLSATQEELIRQHTDSKSQVIIMLDENDAGRAGRED